jgi:hypothetical protein
MINILFIPLILTLFQMTWENSPAPYVSDLVEFTLFRCSYFLLYLISLSYCVSSILHNMHPLYNSAQHAPTLQFCTTCTHSTTYILPKFNCFSPLTVKLSPGQVSFLERNFSYLSDRNRQTDDTFLLVCVTHILFQWLNPELPVTIREGKHVCWILVNINHDGVLRCDAVQSGRRFLLLSIYWQQFPTKRRCPKIYVDIITH